MAHRFASFFDRKCFLLCLLFFLYGASASVDTVKEKTLAMIKPDGVEGNHVDAVKKIILDSGFSITEEIELQLAEDKVKRFYAEHSSKSFFSNLVQYMASGPVVIMVLEKENAIADWRALIGPTDAHRAKVTHPNSVRALCGVNSERNCVHGSDSPQSAAREISFSLRSHLQALFQSMMNCKSCTCNSRSKLYHGHTFCSYKSPVIDHSVFLLGNRIVWHELPWDIGNSIWKLKEVSKRDGDE